MSITINLFQAEAILEAFGGDDCEFTLAEFGEEAHSGAGLYGYYTEYPEEGALFFGESEQDQARGNAISEERQRTGEALI